MAVQGVGSGAAWQQARLHGLRPGWLQALRAGADQPPARPRVPLWWGEVAIGSVVPEVLGSIGLRAEPGRPPMLFASERGWHVCGDLTATLERLAQALRAAGLAHAWRNEQLAVCDASGCTLGTVERAVVRPLGLATRAVHLAAVSPSGSHWVQQRAFDKPNDPGLWDTLMGGMVPACDTLHDALARETWEEAGLRLEALQHLSWAGHLTVRRPCGDAQGVGYVVERIDWWRAVLPAGVAPANQDGEVAQFGCLRPDEVVSRLHAGEFTSEAALILAADAAAD